MRIGDEHEHEHEHENKNEQTDRPTLVESQLSRQICGVSPGPYHAFRPAPGRRLTLTVAEASKACRGFRSRGVFGKGAVQTSKIEASSLLSGPIQYGTHGHGHTVSRSHTAFGKKRRRKRRWADGADVELVGQQIKMIRPASSFLLPLHRSRFDENSGKW